MPEILRDIDQIWSFSTYFYTRPQYKILRKSVQWEPRCGVRADGQTHRNRDGKQQIADVQTRLQVFSKPINACRGSKFVTHKYSDTRAFACHFRPTVCRKWVNIFTILRKKSDYFPK